MKRPSYSRPTDHEFDEQLHNLSREEATSVTVQWLISECRRARAQEADLKKQLQALRGDRHL